MVIMARRARIGHDLGVLRRRGAAIQSRSQNNKRDGNPTHDDIFRGGAPFAWTLSRPQPQREGHVETLVRSQILRQMFVTTLRGQFRIEVGERFAHTFVFFDDRTRRRFEFIRAIAFAYLLRKGPGRCGKGRKPKVTR